MNPSFSFAVGKVPLCGHLVTKFSVCEKIFYTKKKKINLMLFYRKKSEKIRSYFRSKTSSCWRIGPRTFFIKVKR